MRAPAAHASGRTDSCTLCLAPVGQPTTHWQEPLQPVALRRRGAACQPRRSAPASARPAVVAEDVHRLGGHVEGAFDLVEVRAEAFGGREAEVVRPACQHMVRSAVAGPGVDDGRAADRAAHRKQQGRIPHGDGRPAVAVEVGEPVERGAPSEGRCGVVVPLLQYDDAETGPGQGPGRHGATRAGADDHGVRRGPGPPLARRGAVERRIRARQPRGGYAVFKHPLGPGGQQNGHLEHVEEGQQRGAGAERAEHGLPLRGAEAGQPAAGAGQGIRVERTRRRPDPGPRGRGHRAEDGLQPAGNPCGPVGGAVVGDERGHQAVKTHRVPTSACAVPSRVHSASVRQPPHQRSNRTCASARSLLRQVAWLPSGSV